jgi:hypothetical protein
MLKDFFTLRCKWSNIFTKSHKDTRALTYPLLRVPLHTENNLHTDTNVFVFHASLFSFSSKTSSYFHIQTLKLSYFATKKDQTQFISAPWASIRWIDICTK